MMSTPLDEKGLERWKEAFAKSGIKYDTDDEYREAVHNLIGYFEALLEMDARQKVAQQAEQPT